MSSIESSLEVSGDRDAPARRFWRERLVAAAAALRARGVRFFAVGPDESLSTYYTPSDEKDVVQLLDPAQHAELLRARWQCEGLPELVELAQPICDLAAELKPSAQDAGDISPLIYVMY